MDEKTSLDNSKMDKKKYQVYPEVIDVGSYYWWRKLVDNGICLVKVIKKLQDECFVVECNEKIHEKIHAEELLIFEPNSTLFKTLMKHSVYRNDIYIKKALQKMNHKPERYMKCEKENYNTKDYNIEYESFFTEYQNFLVSDKGYYEELLCNPKLLIVSGTNNLDLHMLYKTVCENGGMERVTDDQKWKFLFYCNMSKTNVSYTIRTYYKKHLYEFENMRRRVDDEYDFNYKFSIMENVYLYAYSEMYYGTVKLRRNKGLNQYYIQFCGWSKEYSEWFCEDVLNHYTQQLTCENRMKRKTRSSKANNLIDDPLTREKHCHFSNKNNTYNSIYADNLHASQDNTGIYSVYGRTYRNQNKKCTDRKRANQKMSYTDKTLENNKKVFTQKNERLKLIHKNEYEIFKTKHDQKKQQFLYNNSLLTKFYDCFDENTFHLHDQYFDHNDKNENASEDLTNVAFNAESKPNYREEIIAPGNKTLADTDNLEGDAITIERGNHDSIKIEKNNLPKKIKPKLTRRQKLEEFFKRTHITNENFDITDWNSIFLGFFNYK
ncbi:hypothetical protein COBT_000276 [Conglomerata obtusa]